MLRRSSLMLGLSALVAGLSFFTLGAGNADASDFSFDFAANADGAGERGGQTLVLGPGMIGVSGSVSVSLTGTAANSPDPDFAYLDGSTGPNKPGGAGVCGALTSGAQCTPSSDDSIQSGEVLTLDFGDQMVEITALGFGDHGAGAFDGSFYYTLTIDGVSSLQPLLADASGLSLVGSVFSFAFLDPTNCYYAEYQQFCQQSEQFYLQFLAGLEVVKDVPAPAALGLFGLGLMGLGALRRRRA